MADAGHLPSMAAVAVVLNSQRSHALERVQNSAVPETSKSTTEEKGPFHQPDDQPLEPVDQAGQSAQSNGGELQRQLETVEDIAAAGTDEGAGATTIFEKVKIHYEGMTSQTFVASLIIGNFFCNIVEMQFDPNQDNFGVTFIMFMHFWNTMFTIELGINMFANWGWKFWKSGWNIFDVIVVIIGLLLSTGVELPESMGMIRTVRAFRVFRLFKRIKALRKILHAVSKAIVGVCTSFLILFITQSIYALLAVELFRKIGEEECEAFFNGHGEHSLYITIRDECFGEEYFGNYGKAMYTLFQVLTGESWSEAVARPTIHSYLSPWGAFGASFYYLSFVALGVFILLNIVVTVLLDKMVEDDDDTAHMTLAEIETMRRNQTATVGNVEDVVQRIAVEGSDQRQAARSDIADLRHDLQMLVRALGKAGVINVPESGLLNGSVQNLGGETSDV